MIRYLKNENSFIKIKCNFEDPRMGLISKVFKAAAAGPIIAPRPDIWTPVGEPDRIEVVRVGLELMKRRPISDAEADVIGGY